MITDTAHGYRCLNCLLPFTLRMKYENDKALYFFSFLILHVTGLLTFGMFSELVFVLCEIYVF